MDTPLYIDPLTDFGFKKLFTGRKNKKRLLRLINCVLEPYGHTIHRITDINTERLGEAASDKIVIFDISVQGQHGEQVIIEVQRCKQEHYIKRSLFYTSRAISQSLSAGEDYGNICPVYSIHILNFVPDTVCFADNHLIDIRLRNDKGVAISDSPLFVYVILPNFADELVLTKQERDAWFYLLKRMGAMTTKPKNFDQEPFMEFLSDAEYNKLSKKDRTAFDLKLQRYRDWKGALNTAKNEGLKKGEELGLKKGEELGLKKGEELGLKKGLEQGRLEMLTELTWNLFSRGMAIDEIASMLGVSAEELQKILEKS